MFSVFIPAYKAKYLSQAIESILEQSFADFELIVVNDKSPDNIQEIVSKFIDPRIRYYENEKNLGKENLIKNWNNCMLYASKTYGIMFSDDDYMHKDFLLEIYQLIQKYPKADVFSTRVAIVNKENKIIQIAPSSPEAEHYLNFIWHRVYGYREVYAPNYAFRLSAMKEIGGFVDFPLAWGSDDATWFSLAKRNGLVSTDKILCFWRWSESNLSNTGDFFKKLQAAQAYNYWLDSFVIEAETGSDELTIIKEQILKKMPERVYQSKLFLVERLVKNMPLLKAYTIFLKHKKAYSLSNKMFAYAVAKKVFSKNEFNKA